MTLPPGLATARDLFAKLGRDAQALEDEVTSDRFFNFFVTGYSLIDWIENDPSIPASAKGAIKDLRKDTWLKVCGDLAIASKHFKIEKRKPITSAATTSQGYGVGRSGKGDYDTGELSIEVCLSDGTKYHGLDLVRGVLASWRKFFAAHGIQPIDATTDHL